ncbi:MAG: PEP-CTERM system histidine kinase PrsK [Gammaproteobacteria bacterium]|nr:MAG: PEP-CTERM system histidine kinase PrsK [Gammaproteobacteria bacterium]
MLAIELASSLSGAALFLILGILLLINWRGQIIGTLLIAACGSSVLYFGWLAFTANSGSPSTLSLQQLELLRATTWLILLARIVGPDAESERFNWLKGALPVSVLAFSALFAVVITVSHGVIFADADYLTTDKTVYFGFLLMALTGLLLVEQMYRKTRAGYRWAIKYLCLGVGGIFFYEFVIYSDAVLFRRVNPDLWSAKGAVNAVCVPLIAVSVRRIREWNMGLFVSRHIILQSSMLLLAGLYLSFMAVSGYYVRVFGGTWGGALQTVFVFAAILGLLVLVFSSDLRARLRIFLVKHFYENKYDYREEWLSFTKMLAEIKGSENVYQYILKAFADIMRCNGGGIWILGKSSDEFVCVEELNLGEAYGLKISSKSDFARFLTDEQWVINLENYRNGRERYEGLEIPDWLNSLADALVIPLIKENNLKGLVVLTRSDQNVSYNWEDYDLLKTMGHQAAGYIALIKTTEDLAQAKQFEAFNRLSAFVVHDIKNLVAQLSLVSSNARKYRDSQEFLEDAFETIDNSVNKMNRLLQSLKKGTPLRQHEYANIDLCEVIKEVIQHTSLKLPAPTALDLAPDLVVRGDLEQIKNVLQHLVQNAQEATPADGSVEISLVRENESAIIRIRDTGIGMDQEFIRNRLFKPFDTTKGNAGMGIGAYESMEVIRGMGGDMEVISNPGEGSLFTLIIPLAQPVKVSI